MIEYDLSEQAEIPPGGDSTVRVIGIGGAGANVLDRMALEGSDDADLLTLNTDVRALSSSVSSNKIQLGQTLLKGMGAGGDPELGKQGALEAVDEIRNALRGYKMAFVCVGLGGGTGSGAAPEVCRVAKEEGVFLVVFATLPFSFEGKRRMDQALEALDRVGRYANAVVTFDNDRMGELIVPKEGVQQAFAAADKIISQAIRATMKIVSHPGIIRIGMDEILSALNTDNSRCLFGFGAAKGDNRAQEALEQALKSPLLDTGKMLADAKNVLVHVGGGDSMTLFEIELVMQELSKHIDDSKTQILFGTGTDKKLGGGLTVTIISSLSGIGGQRREAPATSPELSQEPDTPAPRLGSPLTAPMSPPPAPLPEPEKNEPVANVEEIPSAEDLQEEKIEPGTTEETSSPEASSDERSEEEASSSVEEEPIAAEIVGEDPEQEPGMEGSVEEAVDVEVEEPTAEEESSSPGEEEEIVSESSPEEPEPEVSERKEKKVIDLQPVRKTAVVPPKPKRKLAVETPVKKRSFLNLGRSAPEEEPAEVSSEADQEVVEEEGVDSIGKMLAQGVAGSGIAEEAESTPDSPEEKEPVEATGDAPEPTTGPVEAEEGEVVVAQTEDSQKISLSRLMPGAVPPVSADESIEPVISVGDDPLDPTLSEIDEAAAQHQQMLQLEPLSKGRFAKSEPTIVDGEDMDVPTFLRKRRK